MKVLILAVGLGTKTSEESGAEPNPMINIGRDPLSGIS